MQEKVSIKLNTLQFRLSYYNEQFIKCSDLANLIFPSNHHITQLAKIIKSKNHRFRFSRDKY